MSQADFTIPAGESGLDYRTLDTAGKAALASHHIGASAPTYVVTGMLWMDNSANPLWTLKMYDGTDWISMGVFNVTTNYFSPANAILTDSSNIYSLTAGSATAFTATVSPAPTALSTGMVFNLKAHTSNSGTTPTLNVNSLGAKTITKQGNAVAAGDIVSGGCFQVMYDGTNFQLLSAPGTIQTVATAANVQNGTTLSSSTVVTPLALGALWVKGTATAASPLVLSTNCGYYVVSGNTGISSISYTAVTNIVNGQKVNLRFTGTPLLTHNSTSFVLPGGINIQVVAGDYAEFVTEDGTNWRCVNYQRGEGTATGIALGKATNFSITLADHGKCWIVNQPVTVSLDALANFPTGFFFDMQVSDVCTGQVTVNANGTEKFQTFPGALLGTFGTLNVTAGSILRFTKIASAWAVTGKFQNFVAVGTPTAAAHAAALTALGWQPKNITAVFTNLTTEGGWAVGDQIVYSTAGDIGSTTGTGVMAGIDATTSAMNYVIGVNGTKYLNKTTGAIGTITPANWSLTIYYSG